MSLSISRLKLTHTNRGMKLLLIPVLALTFCQSAASHQNTAEIRSWANAAEAIGEIKTVCVFYDQGLTTFKIPGRIIADQLSNKKRTKYEKALMVHIALELNKVKNEDCRALIESYRPEAKE